MHGRIGGGDQSFAATYIMSDHGDNNFITYIYRGEEGEIIPDDVTRIIVDVSVWLIRAEAFRGHTNIVEVICHNDVEKIGTMAFRWCRNLRRVVMPGVKVVFRQAFFKCDALTDVECGKLELIKVEAFAFCESLRSINLPSARVAERKAFDGCKALKGVKFSKKLEGLSRQAFCNCRSLERIQIPLKDGMIEYNDIFQGCESLRQVDLVEGAVLQETIAALQFDRWRRTLNKYILIINRHLTESNAGSTVEDEYGVKAMKIRVWIRFVLRKIDLFKAGHRRFLNEAATLLELAIWKANLDDNNGGRIVREGVRTTRGSVKRARRELCITSGASIVIKNVLPFLELK